MGCGITAGANNWGVTGAIVDGTMTGAAIGGSDGLSNDAGGLLMSLYMGLDEGPKCLVKSS